MFYFIFFAVLTLAARIIVNLKVPENYARYEVLIRVIGGLGMVISLALELNTYSGTGETPDYVTYLLIASLCFLPIFFLPDYIRFRKHPNDPAVSKQTIKVAIQLMVSILIWLALTLWFHLKF